MRGSYNGYYIALPRQKWQFDSATPLKITLQVGEACSSLQSPSKEIVYESKTPTVKFVEVRIYHIERSDICSKKIGRRMPWLQMKVPSQGDYKK